MKLGDSFFLRSTEYTSQILMTPGSFIVTSCLHFAVTFAQRCCVWFPVVMEQKEAARVCVMFLSLLCLLHSKNTTLLRRHKAWCVYMASRDVGNWRWNCTWRGAACGLWRLSAASHTLGGLRKSSKTSQWSDFGWIYHCIANFFWPSRGICVGSITPWHWLICFILVQLLCFWDSNTTQKNTWLIPSQSNLTGVRHW